MNKRQRKKREKKCLPVLADESNLLTMTNEEVEKAIKKKEEFAKKYSYRKKYKNLKGKHLYYYFGVGEELGAWINNIRKVCKNHREPQVVTQNIADFINDNTLLKEVYKGLNRTGFKQKIDQVDVAIYNPTEGVIKDEI